jgi:hypothetical protein
MTATNTAAVALLTSEPVAKIVAEGGSGNWAANLERIRKNRFVVLIRNGNDPKSPTGPTDAKHGEAFLVGRISGAQLSPLTSANGRPRIFVEISEFATISVPGAWGKSQNPVWFTDLGNFGIDPSKLEFRPLKRSASKAARNFDLAEIKQMISLRHNVPASAVVIEIRL